MRVQKLLLVAISLCFTNCSSYKFSLVTFTSKTPVQNIIWDSFEKQLLVGATNHLIKLDSNLTELQDTLIGPVQDNVDCPPSPIWCDYPRKDMNNDPKILLEYAKNIILMCGTANQGMCYLFKKSDMKRITLGLANDSTSYVAGRENVVAFISNGVNHEQSIYTANTYDGRVKEFAQYSLSSRYLDIKSRKLPYSSISEHSITALDFHDSFKNDIEFIYGFSYNGFAYFLSTQILHHDIFETRLGRVCEEDHKFTSYSEIPLRCMKRPLNFNLATTAYLGDMGQSEQKLWGENETGMKSLYVVFGNSLSGSQIKLDLGSVLCIFPMPQIEDYFWNATRDCTEGRPGSYRLRSVHGHKVKCEKGFEVGDEYVEKALCNPGSNDFILGPEMVTGILRVNITEMVTSLAITSQNDIIVGFLGSSSGNILKYVLEERDHNSPLYNVSLFEEHVTEPRILRNFAFDNENDNLFLLADNKVVKFPAKSCSPYTDCLSCLTRADPIGCGWCDDRCASQSECSSRIQKFDCPPMIFSVNPRRAHVNGGTLLNIIGDNFGSQNSGEKARIVVLANGVDCEIIRWEYKRIQCRTTKQNEVSSGPVSVSVEDRSYEHNIDINGTATSEYNIHILNPEFFGISPWFGPYSGGTNVTLSGENLDIGSNLTVTLSDVNCEVLFNNGSHVVCTSGWKNETNLEVDDEIESANVVVEIDGNVMMTTVNECSQCPVYSDRFQYRPDPVVDNFWPRVASYSLGINLTVTGHHLDSVFRPRLVVTVVTDPLNGIKKDIIQDCYPGNENGTAIYCPTPSLDHLILNSPPTSQLPLQTHITFLMDGASDVLLYSYKDNRVSQLLYYPDPVFHRFERNVSRVTTDTFEVHIKGENINLALQKEFVLVFIDRKIICRIFELTNENLRCIIANGTELSSTSKEFAVTVKVGDREFWIGNIELVEPPRYFRNRVVIFVVLCLILFLGAVLLVLYRRGQLKCTSLRKSNETEYIVSFNANSTGDRVNGNEYSPCVDGHANLNPSPSLKAPKISEETIHLLKVENILFERTYLILEDEIGQGHFGRVYKGEHRLPSKEASRQVAVKTLHNCRYQDEESVESFLQEGLMMKDFHHHHVLTLIGVCFEDNGFPMVILPFMENGDLRSYIQNENNEPTIRLLIEFGIQISEGMQYLSELKFIHRDLAARNCMLDSDLTVKVADFGLSRDVYEREYYSSDNKKSKLPVKWMAPESLEKGSYSTKTDVWSYGVVLWELLTRGVTPYPEVGNWEILQYIKEGRRMLQPSFCPDDLYRIMLRCWNEDPRKRPNFVELSVETKELMSKMESNHRQRTVGLSVNYVNVPQSQQDTNVKT